MSDAITRFRLTIQDALIDAEEDLALMELRQRIAELPPKLRARILARSLVPELLDRSARRRDPGKHNAT